MLNATFPVHDELGLTLFRKQVQENVITNRDARNKTFLGGFLRFGRDRKNWRGELEREWHETKGGRRCEVASVRGSIGGCPGFLCRGLRILWYCGGSEQKHTETGKGENRLQGHQMFFNWGGQMSKKRGKSMGDPSHSGGNAAHAFVRYNGVWNLT